MARETVAKIRFKLKELGTQIPEISSAEEEEEEEEEEDEEEVEEEGGGSGLVQMKGGSAQTKQDDGESDEEIIHMDSDHEGNTAHSQSILDTQYN